MARMLSEDEALSELVRQTGKRKYPWHKWLNGEWWYLIQGTDYFCNHRTFQQAIYRKQYEYGKVTVHTMQDGLLIRLLTNVDEEGIDVDSDG